MAKSTAKKTKSETLVVSGKRKRAIARGIFKPGKGKVKFNRVPIDLINPEVFRLRIREPLELAGPLAKSVDINVTVKGGGVASQIEAARLAVAKGLVEFSKSEELRKTFLDYDRHLLIADTRRNEPHKPNDSKPRAKRQKSYR